MMLSVVVPAHDEAPNLPRLVEEVRAALDALAIEWELIVVDDGSRDDTPQVLARLAAVDGRVRALRLHRRSGQTAALVAGFGAAGGALIATLDADLQCSPHEIAMLLATLGDADLACGARTGRRDPWRRRFVSALTNGARRCVLAPGLRDLACPLRVFRADALARVESMTALFDGSHRWMPALFVLAGLRVVQRPVTHQPRRAGVSKYTATGRAVPIARETARVLAIALRRSRRLRAAALAVALSVLALLFLYGIPAWPLTEPDEGRNAEVAREMLERGSWSLPYFDQLPYLDKPVLLFWLIAAAYRVLGIGELAARLPSALAAIGTVAITFATTRALLDARRAVVAAVALATMPLVFVFARAAIFDLLLTCMVSGAVFALVQARLTGAVWRWWPAAGLCVGLAALTKGPVGIALPLLAWVAGRGALPPMRGRPSRWAAVVGVLVTCAVVVPWLGTVQRAEPGFLRYALLDETFGRLTSTAGFNRGGPLYYYVPVLAWATGVWGLLLAGLAPALIRHRHAEDRSARTIAFALRTAVAMVVFFSLSASKRPQYVLPALVPVAILIAAAADAEPARFVRALRVVATAALATGLVAGVIGCLAFTPARGPLRVVTPALLTRAGLVLAPWGFLTAMLARRRSVAIACAALLMPALALVLLQPLQIYAESRSARDIAAHVPTGTTVICFETFPTSLPFYLRRPVVLVTRDARELTSRYVSASRDRLLGHGTLQPVSAFADVLAATPNAMVLTTHPVREIEQLTGRRFAPVYTHRRTVLLRPEP